MQVRVLPILPDYSVTHHPGLYRLRPNVRCTRRAIEGSSLRSHFMNSPAGELGRYVTVGYSKERDRLVRNRRALSDAERLALIAEAVSYCQRVAAMGMPISCYTKALREPIFFLWECRNGPKRTVASHQSLAAARLKPGRGELIYDHAVPFSLLQRELMSLTAISPDFVRAVLERFMTIVLITREEHQALHGRGLGSTMPKDWDGNDPLARYSALGIELMAIENPVT